MKRKFAFIKIRRGHTVISQIIKMLRHSFPEYELELIDIRSLLKQHPLIVLINIFHIIRLYGFGVIFCSKDIIYNRFFGTPYMYHAIRNILNQNVERYVFTFQDCSLFNGKIGLIPNFVYTDHTVLENRFYPDFIEKRDMLDLEWMLLERDIYHDAEIIFTRYAKIKESLIRDYSCFENNVINVYYAPNINRIDRNNDKYSSKNILFIGFDWHRKGGDHLISAFKKVLEKDPEAKLTIIGCCPRISIKNVFVVGKINSDMLADYYNSAAVFCMPTRKEHAAIVFTEAMGYSLPVVGTPIGAIPEYIENGKNGFLINVGDIDNLAEKLTLLISNPNLCREFGCFSYSRYKIMFDFDKVTYHIKSSINSRITH